MYFSKYLTSIAVDIYSTEYCQKVSAFEDDLQPEVEFCAGDLIGERGACQGNIFLLFE